MHRTVVRSLAAALAIVLVGIAVFAATSALHPATATADFTPSPAAGSATSPAAADFAPPAAATQAKAIVARAQAADVERRAAIAQSLGLQSDVGLPKVQSMFFQQTGFPISDRLGFLTFWRERGGALIFGYPLSGELVESGKIVQYFQNARFEYHPEHQGQPDQVMLSLLGAELYGASGFADGDPSSGRMFFPETGNSLNGKFLQFWQKRGGLAIFGMPISEPFDEVSPVDGQVRTTQYFERARFEFHPEELGSYYQNRGLALAALREVQLGNLGQQALVSRSQSAQTAGQLPGVPAWSPQLFDRHVDVDLSQQRLTAYEGDIPVFSAAVATGKDGFNTPVGTFAIYEKHPMQTMVGNAQGEEWTVPNIPWVQYIVGGVAFHGTYWHDRWGTGVRMSHGCVNLNIDDAQWLYEWADIGTPVTIHY